MSKYIPPNKHQVNLNFKDPVTGSTNLDFAADDQNSASLDVVVNTVFTAEFNAESYSNDALDAQINTAFYADLNAVSGQFSQLDVTIQNGFIAEFKAVRIDQYGAVDVVIQTNFAAQFEALFNINHLVGVSYGFDMSYQKAIACLSTTEIPWAKPILRVSNEALFYEHGLVISNQKSIQYEQAESLNRAVRSLHEQATGLSSDAYIIWEEGDKRFIHQRYLHEETIKLRHNRETAWQEMIRRRKTLTYSHEVAHVFEKRFSFEWDKGLELIITSDIAWDKAKAIHYRKHPIQPWSKPEIPEYVGSTDLNFVCLCHDVDSHNVILNFGADDCIPGLPAKNWWYILNSLEVTRLDTGQKIIVMDGNYNTDRSRWCWSYGLTVPASEINKLEPIAGQPVILKIMVNGNEHHMLLESRNRSRRFAQDTYTLTGRSQSALLDAPSSPTRSFLQENERTSVQLAQAELDRVNSNAQLDWKLIDELGWILPINSLSYSNFTPIAAIKLIVESAGGFIYSEKNGNTLSIRPLYKKTFWDPIVIADYDRLVPINLVKDQSTDYEIYPDYNGITLSNDRSGLTGQVKRTGTSADTLLETVNDSLFTVESMAAFGKAKLAKAGMVEKHSLNMPISAEVGECIPGELIAFNAEWWGIVDSVSVSFNHATVNQTIKVERVNRDE